MTALGTPVRGSMAGYPSLAGRTIFISGGGSGIGACIVERFAQQGSRVAFCDVADEPAQALVARLAPASVRYGHCDVRDIAELERMDQMPRLLKVLAHHSGQLTNFTQIGGQIGLDDKTTRKYEAVLEQLFLVRRLEPWFRNRFKRLVKTPKLHFLDSGLLAAILGTTEERIGKDRSVFGPLLETFAFAEVMKQVDWLAETCRLYHYRDKDQDEVDIIVEGEGGDVVGIEVKAAATVTASDFKGLRKLSAASGKDFKLGVVLYDAEQTVPFGERMFAVPISCLWA